MHRDNLDRTVGLQKEKKKPSIALCFLFQTQISPERKIYMQIHQIAFINLQNIAIWCLVIKNIPTESCYTYDTNIIHMHVDINLLNFHFTC